MDITNENFMQCLPEITQTIQDCDFIAIDTELSGLLRDRSQNRFDLPEERFAKLVDSSRDYFIMQFGLSCFTRTSDFEYTNRTYNFYIFPQPHKFHGDINRTLSLQAHAIQFLTQHGFDFNKLFKHGVSYLTFQEMKLVKTRLKADHTARSKVVFDKQGVPTFVPSSMIIHCREWVKNVQKFVTERKKATELGTEASLSNSRMSIGTNNSDEFDSEIIEATGPKPEDRFEIRECTTPHRRKVMKQVLDCLPIADNLKIDEDYDSEKNETYLVIYYIDKKVKMEQQKNDLILSKGFLEIMELVIVNKKPLVGHNLNLDLIQIINQFMEPLNDDYDSFKETCHSLFPLIYDTKYIAHSILDPRTLTSNQSRLNDLYCQLRDHASFPKIEIKQLGINFDEDQLPHQAGYDAFMSGYAFIVLCEAYVGQTASKKCKQTKIDDMANAKPPPVFMNNRIIDEFANKVHLSYSYDFKYFDLAGDERQPDRSHVFYMEFPSGWCLDDIFRIFSNYGGVEAAILNKTSALCALRDRKQLDAVIKHARGLSRTSHYRIMTYETYMESFKGNRQTAGDEDMDSTDA